MASYTQTFLLIGLLFFAATAVGYFLSLFAIITMRVKGQRRSSFPVMRFIVGGIYIGFGIAFFYTRLPQFV